MPGLAKDLYGAARRVRTRSRMQPALSLMSPVDDGQNVELDVLIRTGNVKVGPARKADTKAKP